ncbi:MAG: hemolysin family protein [Bryobacterales bacterium]|nr:hemolysin family protein [Bryobacterales bacterium]
MTLLWVCAFIPLILFIILVSVMQRVYQELLRLRLRDSLFLDNFRLHLEDRIGVKASQGAQAFSMAKHAALVLLVTGFALFAITDGPSLWTSAAEATGTSMVVVFVALYFIPPILFQRTSGRWLLFLRPVLSGVVLLMRPIEYLLVFVESLAQLGNDLDESEDAQDPDEHLEAFIEAGEEEGIIEQEDRKLIRSVVEFGDKTVREVMTPRTAMVVVHADSSLADFRKLLIGAQFSRFPVYENDLDQIIGFVHIRDLFYVEEQDLGTRKVRELARPIRAVPESKLVSQVLKEMQAGNTHMAIVVNEYGNTAGLVTLEDVMEEIFGEIRDEYEPEHDVASDANGGYIVPGSLDLDRLDELFGYHPEPETESTTVGGLIAEWVGHVPRVGEVIEHDGFQMEVLAGNELRVDKVRVSRRTPETTDSGN